MGGAKWFGQGNLWEYGALDGFAEFEDFLVDQRREILAVYFFSEFPIFWVFFFVFYESCVEKIVVKLAERNDVVWVMSSRNRESLFVMKNFVWFVASRIGASRTVFLE